MLNRTCHPTKGTAISHKFELNGNSNLPIEAIWYKNNPERDRRIATFCPK